jgi:hypothetical protein
MTWSNPSYEINDTNEELYEISRTAIGALANVYQVSDRSSLEIKLELEG